MAETQEVKLIIKQKKDKSYIVEMKNIPMKDYVNLNDPKAEQ